MDWLFDGDDIIAACRTAYDDGLGGAHNNHDANYLTFHRIANFRTKTAAAAQPGLVTKEFIFDTAPFASSHASTIVETQSSQLVAAWFGGQRERSPDVGIWLSRHVGGKWTAPVEVANGVQPDGTRLPCWNPVLFQPKDGRLMLFYKVGPNPASWWAMLRTSGDDARTWSDARRLPDGMLGPVKNKPVQLPDGTLLCPCSTENSPEKPAWRVHFERTGDGGATWQRTPDLPSDHAAIQPSVLVHPGGKLQAVGRTQSGRIFESWSDDGGKTWSPLALTPLPNPNCGIDAVTLRDGRHLLVYNHTAKGRSPLNVAVSNDGKNWQAALVLDDEPGKEFSYPACIQTRDGLVHITYTWQRKKIAHVVLDPAKLELRPMPSGEWPQ